MLKGFKDFVLRGNVVDLAVAVVIGAAFATVVTAFTSNIITPVLALFGSTDVDGFGFFLNSDKKATFIDLGAIITAIVNFVIVAAVIYFLIVTPMQRLLTLRKKGEVEEMQATPEDIALLQEIRDLLREQRQGQAPPSIAPAP